MIPEDFTPNTSPSKVRRKPNKRGGYSVGPIEAIRSLMNRDGSFNIESFEKWRQYRNRHGLPTSLQNLADDVFRAYGIDHFQSLNDALLDLALGHDLQETDKKGKKKVYTVSPNFNALKLFMDRIAGPATSHDEVLFNIAKGKAVLAEESANIALAKAQLAVAQRERAIIDTKVYAMAQMDQKEIGRKFKSLLNACLAWVTMTPRATMAKACESDEAWQQYKADFGAKLKAKARDILLSDEDGDLQTAIESAREEDADDG